MRSRHLENVSTVSSCADADVVKMDVINALDSSSVQPKRRRARKPAASKDTKPPGEEQNLGEGKNTSNTPAISSTPKRSRTSTPAPVKTLADPHQEESSNSVKDQPAASTVQNSCGVPLSEELTNGAPAEPKKKKKRKKEAKEDKQMEEEVKKDGETEDQTVIVQHEEVPDSVVSEEKREKKAKKKKKEQSEREGGQVISEQLPEVTSEASDPLVSAKKKKKKSKSNADGPEATLEESKIIPVEIPGEHSLMVNKEDETNKSDLQDLSEQISKKKKRRKDKADRGTLELADKESSEMADVNGNDQPTDAAPLPPVTPQTEKKKKSKYMEYLSPLLFQSQFLTHTSSVRPFNREKQVTFSRSATITSNTWSRFRRNVPPRSPLPTSECYSQKGVSDVTVIPRCPLNFCN